MQQCGEFARGQSWQFAAEQGRRAVHLPSKFSRLRDGTFYESRAPEAAAA